MNYTCSATLLLLGTLRMQEFKKRIIYLDFLHILFTAYLYIFACLLFSAEIQLNSTIKYFGFMTWHGGKGCFLLTVGALVYDPKVMSEYLCSFLLIMCSILNVVAVFTDKQGRGCLQTYPVHDSGSTQGVIRNFTSQQK